LGVSTDDVITAWVAFADAPVESGAMKFWPGSHLKNQLEHRDTFAEDNLLTRGQEIAVDVPAGEGVDVALKAGEMSLHHVLLAHGSGPNTTDDRRIGYAIRYIPPHVRQLKVRDSATLVRGRDTHGNFDPEPAPHADLDAAALAAHSRRCRALGQGALCRHQPHAVPCLAAASPSPHSVRCRGRARPDSIAADVFAVDLRALLEGRLQGPTYWQVDRFFVSALARAIDRRHAGRQARVVSAQARRRSLLDAPEWDIENLAISVRPTARRQRAVSFDNFGSVPRSPSIWSRPGRAGAIATSRAQWLIERALQVT